MCLERKKMFMGFKPVAVKAGSEHRRRDEKERGFEIKSTSKDKTTTTRCY